MECQKQKSCDNCNNRNKTYYCKWNCKQINVGHPGCAVWSERNEDDPIHYMQELEAKEKNKKKEV